MKNESCRTSRAQGCKAYVHGREGKDMRLVIDWVVCMPHYSPCCSYPETQTIIIYFHYPEVHIFINKQAPHHHYHHRSIEPYVDCAIIVKIFNELSP